MPEHNSLNTVSFGALCWVLLIEFEQYFIGRSADIDDFILNVFGALCGYLLYKIANKLLHNKKMTVGLDKQKGDLK